MKGRDRGWRREGKVRELVLVRLAVSECCVNRWAAGQASIETRPESLNGRKEREEDRCILSATNSLLDLLGLLGNMRLTSPPCPTMRFQLLSLVPSSSFHPMTLDFFDSLLSLSPPSNNIVGEEQEIGRLGDEAKIGARRLHVCIAAASASEPPSKRILDS